MILVAARVQGAPLPDALPPSLRVPPPAGTLVAGAWDRSAPLPLPSPPSSPDPGAPPAPPAPGAALFKMQGMGAHQAGETHQQASWRAEQGGYAGGVALGAGGEAESADTAAGPGGAGSSTEWTSFGADEEEDSGGSRVPSSQSAHGHVPHAGRGSEGQRERVAEKFKPVSITDAFADLVTETLTTPRAVDTAPPATFAPVDLAGEAGSGGGWDAAPSGAIPGHQEAGPEAGMGNLLGGGGGGGGGGGEGGGAAPAGALDPFGAAAFDPFGAAGFEPLPVGGEAAFGSVGQGGDLAPSGGGASTAKVAEQEQGGNSWDPFASGDAAPSFSPGDLAPGVGFPEKQAQGAGFPDAGFLGAGGGFGGGAGFPDAPPGLGAARDLSTDSDMFQSPLGADVPASAPIFFAPSEHRVETDLFAEAAPGAAEGGAAGERARAGVASSEGGTSPPRGSGGRCVMTLDLDFTDVTTMLEDFKLGLRSDVAEALRVNLEQVGTRLNPKP